MFGDIYKGKKVLVTGNTGFKGSWLSLWLNELGADVYGVSKDIPSNPSLFEIAGLADKINHTFEDIRNLDAITKLIHSIQPDFVFHLAAQPIVKTSYDDPVDTMSSNIMGTAHILEALRTASFPCTAVMITSDKCYDNVEWEWGYREHDALGGKDPYSASKGAAELMIKTYFESYFNEPNPRIKVNSVRAGNVIGGADWAANRLVPDMFRSWSVGETVIVRSPNATRPWQHVLEPLSGYLRCGQVLHSQTEYNGLGYNFGPNADQNKSVEELLIEIGGHMNFEGDFELYKVEGNTTFHEAGLLKLNCDRTLMHHGWTPTLHFDETVEFTASWYNAFYNIEGTDMYNYTVDQIKEYVGKAEDRKNSWTD